MSSRDLLSIIWLTKIPDDCLRRVQTESKVQGIQNAGEMLELLCMHCITDVVSHHFWTSGRAFPCPINGPTELPSSFCYIFFSCFIVTSVLQGTVTFCFYLQLHSPRHVGNMKSPDYTSNEPSTMTPHTPACHETRPRGAGSQAG